jgi:hypothetical protein
MSYLGRSIVVDWAIPKNKYETIHTSKENEEIATVKEDIALENKNEDIKEEVVSDVEENIDDTSKTIDDYLTLDSTKNEDDNFVDFETTVSE